jgi:hypothetical protein
MRPTEVVMLTGYLRAHFPSQPVDEFTTEALEELLGPYPAADCKQAVLNLAERGDEWCPPTAIKAEVKRIRAKRIADYGPIDPPAGLDPDDVRGYQRWLEAKLRGIADGEIVAPAPVIEGTRRDVIRELGHIGQSVDAAIAVQPAREAHAEARRVLQEAEADKKRAEDDRRAELERMRREDQAARAALRSTSSEESNDA